jgi:electron transfer flavoprotein alpha subunit
MLFLYYDVQYVYTYLQYKSFYVSTAHINKITKATKRRNETIFRSTKMLNLRQLVSKQQFSNISNSILKRFKNTLVIVEHNNKTLNPVTLNAITAATKIPKNETITCLVVGVNCEQVATEVSKIKVVNKVLLANDDIFKGHLPENVSEVIAKVQKDASFTHILVGSSAFGKNLLPRAAALLDTQPISDIIGIKDETTFVRTIYAGNAIQTIKAEDPIKMMSIRGTAFEAFKSE